MRTYNILLTAFIRSLKAIEFLQPSNILFDFIPIT